LGNLADASLGQWEQSVENLQEKFGGHAQITVVPGHGERGGAELFEHTLELLKEF